MEGLMQKLKVVLDKITTTRARVVAACKSPAWVKPRFLTHIMGPVIALIVIASTFSKTESLNLFSLHATCMALAFVVLMPEGVVAYRNHLLLDSLSPIMSNGTKAKKRTIHLTLQVLASMFAALGLFFIAGNKVYHRNSILPRTWHGVVGAITLLAMVMQVVVGRLKHMSFTSGVIDARNRGKKYRWHGKMGLLLYDLSTVSLVLGLWTFFGLSVVTVVVPVMLAYAWLNVNLQMHETKHITVPVYSEGTDDPAGEKLTAPETKQLEEEGVPESKGEREYPL
ncbi:unnamed protein product [Ectocarpus sp. 12 AP-2014]